jgi:hypothetical protein
MDLKVGGIVLELSAKAPRCGNRPAILNQIYEEDFLALRFWVSGIQKMALPAASANEQLPVQQSSGSIRGTIIDQSGAVVSAARVRLTEGKSKNQEVLSDNRGQFSFANVVPGGFQLTITAAGFATQTFSGVVESGQIQTLPPIVLNIAAAQTTVNVGLPLAEIAQEQMKVEEKQRVLGIVPDFYVSYLPNAAPLNSKQKFNLAWKTATDPFTFVLAGGIAGIQQAQDSFSGYGQGVEGYAKRTGLATATRLSGHSPATRSCHLF